MYGSLGKHGIVLNLCLPDGRAVVADQDQLGCSTNESRVSITVVHVCEEAIDGQRLTKHALTLARP